MNITTAIISSVLLFLLTLPNSAEAAFFGTSNTIIKKYSFEKTQQLHHHRLPVAHNDNLDLQQPPESTSSRGVMMTALTSIMLVSYPLMTLAEDDYEYGAVDAPISIAWGVGALAILTALLPMALQGGEEAFEEMRERDSDEWGKGKKS